MAGLEGKSLKEICDLAKTNRDFYIKNFEIIHFQFYYLSITNVGRGITGIVEYKVLGNKVIIKDLEDNINIETEKTDYNSSILEGYQYCLACIKYLYLKQLI